MDLQMVVALLGVLLGAVGTAGHLLGKKYPVAERIAEDADTAAKVVPAVAAVAAPQAK